MASKNPDWKKGRGKLGVLTPLLGEWHAEADSPMGKVMCTRKFTQVLGGKYVQLDAEWNFGTQSYREHALYGIKDDLITFWSFTSDGKNSSGRLSDGTDIHPDAICFEAIMPAGLARMIYWPAETGMNWAVESKTKKGWNRFTLHHYKKIV
ncbi:MAG: hypothetical protein R3D00_29670 [Bacteroidia bacterium]